jgi:hypothetical protein
MKRFTSLAAAVLTAAFMTVAHGASAQTTDQLTYLTFSGAVQMPGVTLPAGKYVFKLADTSLHNVMQVYDGKQKHIIGQWFFIGRNRTEQAMDRANGKPVVTFMEVPQGTAPPIKYFFYPSDLTGKEFIYPKSQALKLAKATNKPVIATENDAARGGEAKLITVQPNGTTSDFDANANPQETAEVTEPSNTVAYSADNNDSSVGTSGVDQNPAPSQQASNELPKTASPFPLIALFGFLSLAGGLGLRLARNTN